jgi:hypothetical protein
VAANRHKGKAPQSFPPLLACEGDFSLSFTANFSCPDLFFARKADSPDRVFDIYVCALEYCAVRSGIMLKICNACDMNIK